MLQRQPHQESVILIEPTIKNLTQRTQLLTKLTLHQISENIHIPLTNDKSLKHQPTPYTQHIPHHRVQLHPHVLERLLHPLTLRGMSLHQPLPVAREVSQSTHIPPRHQTRAQKTVLEQFSQPGANGHVRLSTRQH